MSTVRKAHFVTRVVHQVQQTAKWNNVVEIADVKGILDANVEVKYSKFFTFVEVTAQREIEGKLTLVVDSEIGMMAVDIEE